MYDYNTVFIKSIIFFIRYEYTGIYFFFFRLLLMTLNKFDGIIIII
jgi:hypothetical protein